MEAKAEVKGVNKTFEKQREKRKKLKDLENVHTDGKE
jgi:hypothetical protein